MSIFHNIGSAAEVRLPRHCTSRPGAMLLITVMILGSVALLISLSIALRGIGELDMGFATSQMHKAIATADACMEESLVRLWGDSAYQGGKILLPAGSCEVLVDVEGPERTISVEASVKQWKRRIQARVKIDEPEMELLEWRNL